MLHHYRCLDRQLFLLLTKKRMYFINFTSADLSRTNISVAWKTHFVFHHRFLFFWTVGDLFQRVLS